MLQANRYKAVLHYFETKVGLAETELKYNNAFELLVAVILSAQCTDKRVNLTTPQLFKEYPNAETLAASNKDAVFSHIKSISYPNNKAKHLVAMAQMLLKEFGGEVPEKVEDLIKLPGVGRKTANVIASVVYNQPTMAVDTHVFRVSNRIGLTLNAKNPLQSEKQLVKFIPKHLIPKAHHWLILHGRYVCLARNPKCEQCSIREFCKFFEKQRIIKNKKSRITLIKTTTHGKEKTSKKSFR